FSDPIADGPVIQRASQRALARGTTLADVLALVRRLRRRSELPLLLFSYLNPLLRFGLARLASEARDAGVDGVLVTALPPERAGGGGRVAGARAGGGPRHRVPGRAHQPRRAARARGRGLARVRLRGEPHGGDGRARPGLAGGGAPGRAPARVHGRARGRRLRP